jgi:hypothetical protein
MEVWLWMMNFKVRIVDNNKWNGRGLLYSALIFAYRDSKRPRTPSPELSVSWSKFETWDPQTRCEGWDSQYESAVGLHYLHVTQSSETWLWRSKHGCTTLLLLLFTGAYSPGWTFGLPFRDFLITHSYRHTVGLLWTSDQPFAKTSTYTGQHNI